MRCVHLDFHTSPYIGEIGKNFDKEKFTQTLKDANVELMTVFAKCHHGYTYYPSKVGTMHPGLNFNLLKEQIDAIHAAGQKRLSTLRQDGAQKMPMSIRSGIK